MTTSQPTEFPLEYRCNGVSEIWSIDEHIVLCVSQGTDGTAFVKYRCETCSEMILVQFDEKYVYDCKDNIIDNNRYPTICIHCGTYAISQLQTKGVLNSFQLYGYQLGLRTEQKIRILYNSFGLGR